MAEDRLCPFTRSVLFTLKEREALASDTCRSASIDYTPISSLGARLQVHHASGDLDDDEPDDSALITGRISSAQRAAVRNGPSDIG